METDLFLNVTYTSEFRKDLGGVRVFTKHVSILGQEIARIETPYEEVDGRYIPIDVPTPEEKGTGHI
ncbi:MAG: hypothetical protein IJ205_08180 [Bacteroidales bacterium]|nr:hypothetical protein [Bacteroidales bacterium]